MTHEEKLVDSIMNHQYNRDKVQKFMDLGLDPKYGLNDVITKIMFDLYYMSSGDGQYSNKTNCGACQDVMFRKMKDFLNYNDNMGSPLVNWAAPVEEETIVEKVVEVIKGKRKRK